MTDPSYAWVNRHLKPGERILRAEVLPGGITADIRRLTVSDSRQLVLRTYVDPHYLARAEDSLAREAGALAALAGTGVPAPELVAVASPSLLMTHLAGRPILADEGAETRVPLLARQLVAIHAVRPAARPPDYVALTTADTVVVPPGADPSAWSAAIDVLRRPAPPYEGCFLHRDFQPGNVLFDGDRITGVVDWAGASWGPADLDVAHCATNLALLHGPAWGLRFVAAYSSVGARSSVGAYSSVAAYSGAGGVLSEERLYWLVRDALACSEEVAVVSQPWRDAGRTDLTTRVVEARLDAYLTALMVG